MRPIHQEFAEGVKLAAIATVCAVLSATLVIGAGRTLTPPDEAVAVDRSLLTRVALR